MDLLKNRLKKDFGDRLKMAISSAKTKQYKIAEFIGVEPANVSRWVTGKHFPDQEHFEKLCAFLNIDQSYFLEQTTSKTLMGLDLSKEEHLNIQNRALVARIRELEAKLTPENERLLDAINSLGKLNKEGILRNIERLKEKSS